ncbi:nucleotide pyrophosphohydrolase [Gordonia phage BrutonGaster]|uniref:Nucleotide pyrophosphohydrolase n=1 Tax=Gordonia phage BrutonGaster TaxID=2530116 RepID=A0A482JKI7_9CAUD|nr:MazG-like pyrophosphatase [Gordonia phage BrutonGaster]QBP33302.1 nucleotide pyrophosphohydrolase [Gordonia phage BrutonGaster]
MEFNDYQNATAATAIYPGAGEGTLAALAYVGLGLGESGEIQGKLKKIIRDDAGQITDEKRDAIKKEMGDTLWYLARLAAELDLSLNDVADANLDKLLDRKDRGVLQGSGDER